MIRLIDELDAYKEADSLRTADSFSSVTLYAIISDDNFHIAIPEEIDEDKTANQYFADMIREIRGDNATFSQMFSNEVHNFFRVIIETRVSELKHMKRETTEPRNTNSFGKPEPIEVFNSSKSSFYFHLPSDSHVSPKEKAKYMNFMESFQFFFRNTSNTIFLNGERVSREDLDNEIAIAVDPAREKPLVLNFDIPYKKEMIFDPTKNSSQNP